LQFALVNLFLLCIIVILVVKSSQKHLILLIHSVLLLLDCLNYFVLGFWVVGTSVAVARNVCSFVLSSPSHLGHVNPGLRLGLNFNLWLMVDESSSSYIRSCVSIKVFQTLYTNKILSLRNNDDPGLNGYIERWFHSLSIDKEGCLELLADLGAGFIDYF
jgi:hypothetical protein